LNERTVNQIITYPESVAEIWDVNVGNMSLDLNLDTNVAC